MRPWVFVAALTALALAPTLAPAASPWGTPQTDARTDPYKSYRFEVFMDGRTIAFFSEASGNGDDVDFRSGEGPVTRPVRVPGVHKLNDITLKRGVVQGGSDLWNWLNGVRAGVDRRDLAIQLRDEAGQPVQHWKLSRCAVAKYQGPHMSGEANDIAVEELSLSCERVELVRP